MTNRTEFDTPDLATSTGYAQWEFFRVLNRLVPEVLEELHDELLPGYAEPRASLSNCDWLSWRVLKNLTEGPEPEEPGIVSVRGAIEAWATTWRISAPWVYGAACNTLEMWHRGSNRMVFLPDSIHKTPATPLYSREGFPEKLMAAFEGFLGYEPTFETEAEFKRRFDSVYRPFLESHIAEQKKAAMERNYPEFPEKRKLHLHLEWVVLYQVREMSPEAIAARHDESRESVKGNDEKYPVKTDGRDVSRQVHKTLDLIKLEPRRPKRGG